MRLTSSKCNAPPPSLCCILIIPCVSSHFLSGSYIGYIPTSIIELNKLVLLSSESVYSSGSASSLAPRSGFSRQLARASTTPDVIGKLSAREVHAGRTGSLDRLKTSSFTTYLEKGPEIRLSLAVCYLRSLPLELFQLERLTVLTLRECSFVSQRSWY